MIQPKDRSTLTEALIPPAGYTFDAGIATTYSLDLSTLMALPLQLAWLATSEDVEELSDPIRLLEGLRRTAKRLSVFSDRGRMHVPRLPHALMGLMEEMIHEVSARHGGAFHPKLWVLRFLPDDPRKVSCIRLLILSRNLTDDRSWDLSLCLEGKPKGGVTRRIGRLPALSVVFPSGRPSSYPQVDFRILNRSQTTCIDANGSYLARSRRLCSMCSGSVQSPSRSLSTLRMRR